MTVPTVNQVGMPAGATSAVMVAWDDNAGAWVPVQVDSSGNLLMVTELPAAAAAADGASNPTAPFMVAANALFNGSTWDRERGNREITLLASAARTAETNSSDQTNYNARGVHVIVDVTVDPAAASITPVIEGKDPVSGKYYEILRGSAIAATGTTVLKVYPGIQTSPNAAASDVLPRTWRVQIEVADTDSMTYSVGAIEVV